MSFSGLATARMVRICQASTSILPSRSDGGAVPFVPTDRAAVATQWRWRNGQDTVARSAFPTGTRSILPSRSDDGAAVARSAFPTGTRSIRRIIVIAVRNPYDLQAFPQLRTYLATYEYTRPALVAAVRVLFGERQALQHLCPSPPSALLHS